MMVPGSQSSLELNLMASHTHRPNHQQRILRAACVGHDDVSVTLAGSGHDATGLAVLDRGGNEVDEQEAVQLE